MVETTEKQFSVFCNMDGVVSEILQDEDHFLPKSFIGKMLCSIVVPSDLDKILNFFIQLKKEQTTIDWEINLRTEKGVETFSFSGSVFNGRIGIAAATTKNRAEILFADLNRINNEQTNMIRALSKEKVKLQSQIEEPPVSYYEELSHLNNDLVNMQRELSKKNRELDELNKLKNQFLGIAAHDLRNPLGIIMSYSDFLLDDLSPELSDDHKKMLHTIQNSSEFMHQLLEELLDISAIESGKLTLGFQKADLLALVTKNVSLNAIIAVKKDIQIQVVANDNIPNVLIDTYKIEQVLNNLISNAMKFSQPGTLIKVSLCASAEEVTVSVADQGQGIPTDEIEKLFKPFQKTSVKSTNGEKSTGLGLSIVRNIILGHGGRIWVESKVGEGSNFVFTIPLNN